MAFDSKLFSLPSFPGLPGVPRIGTTISYDMFFDRRGIISKLDRATRRVLSKFGAFVMTGARRSIRKRKKSSAPGKPPSSHVGTLKRFILFGYDERRQSVVIGPYPLAGPRSTQGPLALSALEHGGPTIIRVEMGRGRKRRKVLKRVNIEARPFMGPAFDAEKPKIAGMWRDSIRP